jgi:RNAse (barnase) inhibitor barstar
MATFDRGKLDQLDWTLFQNGWITLYWKSSLLVKDCEWLEQHGYHIYRFDCRYRSSAKDALDDFGVNLEFPDHYGANFDALDDCLSDLEISEVGGVVIVLLRFDSFAAQDRTTAQTILDILASNARSFMLFGQRLATLVQSDDPRISFAPVGATPVTWNRREWLDKSRCL